MKRLFHEIKQLYNCVLITTFSRVMIIWRRKPLTAVTLFAVCIIRFQNTLKIFLTCQNKKPFSKLKHFAIDIPQ